MELNSKSTVGADLLQTSSAASKPSTPISARPANKTSRTAVFVQHVAYAANIDPVYEDYAYRPALLSEALDFRGRVNSFGGTKMANRKQDVISHGARPSTTDGNHQHGRPIVFWEDLTERNMTARAGEVVITPRAPLNSPARTEDGGASNILPQSSENKTEQHYLKPEITKANLNTDGSQRQKVKKTATFPPDPLVRFNSSGDFKAVVNDLYGKKERRHPNATKWTAVRRLANLDTVPARIKRQATTIPTLTLKEREEKAVRLKAAAARGWTVVRRYVERRQFLRSTSGASLSWTLLKHHLSSMADVEKTRRDLYERYGLIPTKQSDGSYRAVNMMRPGRAALKILTLQTKSEKTVRNLPKAPAFRQTLLKH